MDIGRNHQVSRFILQETTSYQKQYLRPYTTEYSASTERMINETINDPSEVTSPSSLSMIASDLIKPQTEPVAEAKIENGFQEKRFFFMLEIIEYSPAFASQTRYVFNGYTDHLGYSSLHGNMHLDPRMKIYFNNMLVLRDMPVTTSHGQEYQTNVVDARQILMDAQNGYDDPWSNSMPQMIQNENYYSLRPQDVSARIDSGMNPMNEVMQGANIYDSVGMITAPQTSYRRWQSRPHYLSSIASAYKNTQCEQNVFSEDSFNTQDDFGNSIWHATRSKTKETAISNYGFLSLLYSRGWANTGFITYQDLCSILPDADQMAEVNIFGSVQQQKIQPTDGEYWSSTSNEALVATIVQQTLPAIMSDSLVVVIDFTATNQVIGSMDHIEISGYRSFTHGIDISNHIQYFMERVRTELLWDISKGGLIPYSLRVYMDLSSDSYIWVSIDDQPMTLFVSPCFCDSVYSSMITNTLDHIETFGSDLQHFLSNVTGQSSVGNGMMNPANVATNPAMGQQPWMDQINTSDFEL